MDLDRGTDRYQTFWPRFWAGFVDGLIFIPFGLLDTAILTPTRSGAIVILWGVFSYSIGWLYTVWFHARYGQTIGKMVTKVKVMDISENRLPSVKQALLRDSPNIALGVTLSMHLLYLMATGGYHVESNDDHLVDSIVVWVNLSWFVLEVLTMLTNHKRRALHDFIAGTVVVRSA